MMPLFLRDINYTSNRYCIKDRINKYWVVGGSGEDMAMAILGNHDIDNGKTSGWRTDFKMGSNGYWYHIHENVGIIGMNSETSFSTSSNQYDFVLDKLKKASADPNVDWIIVMIHRQFVGSESNHSPNEGGKADIYMPLFTQYKVDIVLQAHNHNYQRSKLVKDNPSDHETPKIVESTSPFAKHRGMIVVTCGLGGHDSGNNLYSLDTNPSWQGYQQDSENGFCKIDFTGTNNSTCTISLVNIDGETLDSVVLQ